MSTEPHILVDATAIPRNRGGVGRYLEHLVPALAALASRVTVVCQPHDVDWLRSAAPAATVVASSAAGRSRPVRLVWEQFGMPRLARRVGATVIFSPHYTMSLFTSIPSVVTLHDATFFSHPELHSRGKRAFFRTWSRISLARAAASIVPSEATRDELLRWVHPRANRMSVAYHGVDLERFRPPSAPERKAALELLAGPSHWIAFLGTLEPRKNVGNLVRAFEELTAGGARPDLDLVLIGGRGWDTELDSLIDTSAVSTRIHRLGFVDDALLAGLLGGADLVAYPSLGEGFGLPVLEAMASGAPVVTTRLLALPEVGGDVAVYSEPDPASLAIAIAFVLDNDTLRDELRGRGVERARSFTWAASADAHLRVFRAVAQEGR